MSDNLPQLKKTIREQAHAARNALPDKDELSRLFASGSSACRSMAGRTR